MQATIATFDELTGAGTVLLDDGVQIAFSAESWAAAHIRHLRPGQRVIIEVDDQPVVTSMRIH